MNATIVQFRALLAVIDLESFGRAAEYLEMTQPAVSHAISSLEKAVGAPVIQRKPRIAPTALGTRILPHARTALASVEAIVREVASYQGRDGGVVRVAATPTVCQGLLPELLQRWRDHAPMIDIHIFEGDDDELPVWLENGMVDAAILVDIDPTPPGGIVLMHDPFLAVIRRDHPLAGESRIHLRDLLDDPFIISTGGCESQIRKMFAKANEPLAITQQVRETGTLVSMVAGDIGVTVMPSLARAMLPPSLVMIPVDPAYERTLTFSGPSSRPWNPLVEVLRDTVRSQVLVCGRSEA